MIGNLFAAIGFTIGVGFSCVAPYTQDKGDLVVEHVEGFVDDYVGVSGTYNVSFNASNISSSLYYYKIYDIWGNYANVDTSNVTTAYMWLTPYNLNSNNGNTFKCFYAVRRVTYNVGHLSFDKFVVCFCPVWQ